MDLKYKHIFKEKDFEIEKLSDELFSLKTKYDIQTTEYETYKIETQKELENRKEMHKNEVRDLVTKSQILSDKCDNIAEKENNKNLKQELEMYKKNYMNLQNEVLFLRREKDSLFSERNDIKLSLSRELDHERMKSASLASENEKNNQLIKITSEELTQLRSKIEEKHCENKILTNEKFNLLFELKEREREFEIFKAELKFLKQSVDEREREIEEQTKANNDAEKERMINEKNEKENYEKIIEDLRSKLRMSKIDGNIVDVDYKQQSVTNEFELNIMLKAKNEEIANLNNLIKSLKDSQNGNYDKIKRDYQNKIQELIRKKNHYKQEVKQIKIVYDSKSKNSNDIVKD
jgi:hypothetical protein